MSFVRVKKKTDICRFMWRIFFLCLFFLCFYFHVQAQIDSVRTDSVRTVKIDSVKYSSAFDAKVQYTARDSIVFDLKSNKLYLYGDAHLVYTDMDLKADKIWIHMDESLIFAEGSWVDSTDSFIGNPVFKDGADTYLVEKMAYNYKTKKGRIAYAKTNNNGDIMMLDTAKVLPDKSFFVKDGKFTTCDADTPHFHISSKRMKVVPNDQVISGPLKMVIEGVPLPIILPFGFFPFSSKRKSGIILPTYGESANRGFFLRGMGFYWAISDYIDFKITADIFTLGGYNLSLVSNYNKRYVAQGNFELTRSYQVLNEKTDPDYSTQTTNFVRWTHNQTFSPTARLTSNVRFGTQTFLRNTSYNVSDYLQSNLNSSIAYQKSFPNSPFSLSASFNADQNLQTGENSISLPNVAVNMARINPLKRKNRVGDVKWYEQIGVSWNADVKNQINLPDSLLFLPDQWKNFRNGMSQNLNISNGFKILKYINISPSVYLREFWYLKSIEKDKIAILKNNELVDSVFNVQNYGFKTGREFGANLALNTNIYGVSPAMGKSKMQFRHTLQPSLGLNYHPDFAENQWGYYKQHPTDTTGKIKYSIFEESVIGGPPQGESKTLGFALNNIFEMKRLPIAKKDSVQKEFKRTRLIDNFGVSGSYNFGADSCKLSPIQADFRTNFLDNLINFNARASLDPYAWDTLGARINVWNYDRTKKILRFTQGQITIGTQLRPETFKKKDSKTPKKQNNPALQGLYDSYMDFDIPWTVNANFSLFYVVQPKGFTVTKTINVSGDFNLTPKWKVGYNTGYDFVQKKLTFTNFNISRDLHCWQATFSWIPFGFRQSYLLTIQVKAQTLQDLKLTKRRDWQDQFKTF